MISLSAAPVATHPDQRPVHDPVAERWVVVSMLKDLDLVPQVMRLVMADMLVDQDCRTVFGIMARRYKAGERYDAFAVATELERSGYCSGPKHSCVLLIDMADDIPTTAHWKYYSAVVRDLANRRRLQGACIDAARELAGGWKPPSEVVADLTSIIATFERVYRPAAQPAPKLPTRRRRAG